MSVAEVLLIIAALLWIFWLILLAFEALRPGGRIFNYYARKDDKRDV